MSIHVRPAAGDASTDRPPTRAGQLVIALTVALLGFLLAVQLRQQEDLGQRLAIERESDLGQILTELTARSDQLLEEIIELKVRLAQTSGSEERERAVLETTREQLAALRILLGVVPVRGRGILLEITDPGSTVGPEVLLDTVQELRDAGAEAIEIDGVRIVASTAFSGQPGTVLVGGRRTRAPYRILAIGAPRTLAEALRIPGGVLDTLAAREGASARIDERRRVDILAVNRLAPFRYARPRSSP